MLLKQLGTELWPIAHSGQTTRELRTRMNCRTKAFHKKLLRWFAAMGRTLEGLSEAEQRELTDWEKKNLGPPKDLASSDWPGWRRYVGEKPVYAEPIRPIGFPKAGQAEGEQIGA